MKSHRNICRGSCCCRSFGLLCQCGKIHSCWLWVKIRTCAASGCRFLLGNNCFLSEVHIFRLASELHYSQKQHEYWCSSLLNIVWSRPGNCLSSQRDTSSSVGCVRRSVHWGAWLSSALFTLSEKSGEREKESESSGDKNQNCDMHFVKCAEVQMWVGCGFVSGL